jgi:hypothetical protein
MKCNLIKFIFFILFVYHLNSIGCVGLKLIPSKPKEIDKKNLIQCKFCQEMFEYDFDLEKFPKNKIQIMKKAFYPINSKHFNVEEFFMQDNVEFISKEISMQYFFKGAENQFNDEKENFLKCKNLKIGINDECDRFKLNLCENMLNFENGTCANFKIHFSNLLLNVKSKKHVDFRFNQNNIEDDRDESIIKKLSTSSLISLTPDYIDKNFNSQPKKHWKAPQPVLLANFENSIGDQLKDISTLATYYF